MSNNSTRIKQVFFIDSAVLDSDVIVANLATDAVYYRLDASQDGLQQMADSLAGYSDLDAVHIISHGAPGSLQLGNGVVTQTTVDDHSAALSSIGNALSETGDLLLYGCDVAQGDVGQVFIHQLATATGADVAASVDLTGAQVQGGNWVLEATAGEIETSAAIAASAQQNYNHVLGVSDYQLAQMSNIAYDDDPQAPDGWTVLETKLSSPFAAVAFQNDNKIVIAYRGTDGVGDWSADTAISGILPWDSQFSDAINFARQIQEDYPNANISVTGHSLGGALAQVVSQMFGFEGATFDPGGARNIANSLVFNTTALLLDLPVNGNGVPDSFTNYIIDGSAVSGTPIVSSDHVGNTVSLENQDVKNWFISKVLENPLLIKTYLVEEQMLLHSIEGITQLMKAMADNTVSALLQQNADNLQAAAVTGDIGVSDQAPDQGVLDFYGTDDNNYLIANNRDNTIYGYAGNDIIYGFAGNDTVYAGDGNDTISTAQGNDTIIVEDGDDSISAGSGDDEINIGVISDFGNATVDGGLGLDTLTFDLSKASAFVMSAPVLGLSVIGASSSWDEIHSFSGLVDSEGGWNYYQSGWNGSYYSLLTFRNIEHVNIVGSQYDDLIPYRGGTLYDGGVGLDTFFANWSTSKDDIVWDNNPDTTITLDGIAISGMERLTIETGSGNDTIRNTRVSTDDYFSTGEGNDTIHSGFGKDTISTGDGNDTIIVEDGDDSISAGSGDDEINLGVISDFGNATVDGGLGLDTLTFDLSKTSAFVMSFPILGLSVIGAYSPWDEIHSFSGLVDSEGGGNYYQSGGNGSYYPLLTFRNIEHVNIVGSQYDDLIPYHGGVFYDGGAGTDTLYANWSTATNAITWNNTPNTTQTVNSSTVSSLEKLLLTTGSGNDMLANTTVTTDDTFITGAGNDTLNGGTGNDVLTGGTGNDTYVVDTTNDVITELKSEGIDTVNSPISWTLQANLENLTLLGKTAINATGNTLNNVLTGNAAANTLNGGTGADKMTGGLGNDVYVVDKVGDKVIETSTLATEIDSVNSSVSYTLAANVENLTLTGTAAVNGKGNGLANTLIGNTANNLLLGNAGNDTLSGAAGNDKLDGGTGNDALTGGAGLDIFRFTTAPTANVDTLTDFSVADDTLQLENAVFKKLASPGVLKAANFVKAGAAHDLNDYLVYNPATGALSYDADGGGVGAAQQIALLGVNLALTNADFVII